MLPSVLGAHLTEGQRAREDLAREVIRGQDLGFVERPEGNACDPGLLLASWIAEQAVADAGPDDYIEGPDTRRIPNQTGDTAP